MSLEIRRWESLSLKQPGLKKVVVSELSFAWTGKISSELPFSPCDNNRNQAATALGERLSFLDFHSDRELVKVGTSGLRCHHPTTQPKTAQAGH